MSRQRPPTKNIFQVGDGLVLGLCLVLLWVLYMAFWIGGGRSVEAMVMVNGENWARLNLYHDQDLRVPGPLGDSHIQVRDSEVRFIDSPCPNKLCILQGPIAEGGEVAVCLPNLVSIRVMDKDPRFDSIIF